MVTSITTVTSIATLGTAAAVSIAAVAVLLIFLATRELAGTGKSRVSSRIARFASVGILPLVLAFATVIIVKITEIL